MKIINKDKEKISFAGEMSVSLANAIRRSAQEIAIPAIDDIEFSKNDSVLYDEILALRLGLVPLKISRKLKLPGECSCEGEGCKKCTIKLKLKKKGPCTVYSEDLEGNAEAVYPKMPVVKLTEGQKLELVANVRLGKGTYHTKHSPGLLYYRIVPNIEISDDCKDCEKCVEACPRNILKMKDGKVKITDKYKCDSCEACVNACENDEIKISPSKELLFSIESWGQIKPEEIFSESINALKDNLKDLK